MKKEKLYDAKWFYKIKSIAKNGDTKKAERFLIEYMDKYPDDQYALTLFITLCFQNNEIEKAEECIKNIPSENTYDRTVQWYHYFYMKDDYDKAYELLLKILDDKTINRECDFYKELYFQRCFLESELKINSGIIYTGYKSCQMINYDRNLAIEHIKCHEVMEDKERHTLFEEEIDIEKLFEQVEIRIKDDIPFFKDETTHCYFFKYPEIENIDFIKGVQFKYIKVITIRNTHNIISMYPIFTKNKLYTAVSLEKEYEDTKSKIKTLSQIEKFNKRYGKH